MHDDQQRYSGGRKRRPADSDATARSQPQIVSGGQTGVDQAALDAAMQLGLPVGGWCPRGRRCETGRIPARYPLQETAARSYAERTEWNVRDSDGTLVVVLDEVSSGTRLTIDLARRLQKPLQVVHLRPPGSGQLLADEISADEQIRTVVEWVRSNRIRVLNVAGPRASSDEHVYPEALNFLQQVFGALQLPDSASNDHG